LIKLVRLLLAAAGRRLRAGLSVVGRRKSGHLRVLCRLLGGVVITAVIGKGKGGVGSDLEGSDLVVTWSLRDGQTKIRGFSGTDRVA